MSTVCLFAQLTTGHRAALSTIGYVGCSISIFCLAITLVTFAVLSWVSPLHHLTPSYLILSMISNNICVYLITYFFVFAEIEKIYLVLIIYYKSVEFLCLIYCVLLFSEWYIAVMLHLTVLLTCSSVSTIRNQRYHIHANLSFAILVAEILLLISARFEPGTVCKHFTKHECTASDNDYDHHGEYRD